MQFLPVERNWIDEKVSIVPVENVGSSDEVLFVRIRPNMYSQLKRSFFRNYFALPIAWHAAGELVRRKRPLDAVSPISFPILPWTIQRNASTPCDFAAKIDLQDVERRVYPIPGRSGFEDHRIALHPANIPEEVYIRVFFLNV